MRYKEALVIAGGRVGAGRRVGVRGIGSVSVGLVKVREVEVRVDKVLLIELIVDTREDERFLRKAPWSGLKTQEEINARGALSGSDEAGTVYHAVGSGALVGRDDAAEGLGCTAVFISIVSAGWRERHGISLVVQGSAGTAEVV